MQLIELPNGSWVSPEQVSAIVPLPRGTTGFCRVVLHTKDGTPHIMETTDDAASSALAAELAGKVNAALTT